MIRIKSLLKATSSSPAVHQSCLATLLQSPPCPQTTFSSSLSASGDTIYALATPPGRSAIAVVRISGPEASSVLSALLPPNTPLPPKRLLKSTPLVHPNNSAQILDSAMVVWMPGPSTFTGQDSVELHLHGALPVISSVLSVLGSMPFVRAAQPGEFTRQAWAAGKMDLMQVEALGDLMAATTPAQTSQALSALRGVSSDVLSQWRKHTTSALAHLEAALEFGEDEELGSHVVPGVISVINELLESVNASLQAAPVAAAVRDGWRIVLAGPVNAGKSATLNALAARPAAIVSSTPGTTRDVVEVAMDIAGRPVLLADTAGLRASPADDVEAAGIHRTSSALSAAHMILVVLDVTSLPSSPHDLFSEVPPHQEYSPPPVVVVLNKCDSMDSGTDFQSLYQSWLRGGDGKEASSTKAQSNWLTSALFHPSAVITSSAVEPRGLTPLLNLLTEHLSLPSSSPGSQDGSTVLAARERVREGLTELAVALERAKARADPSSSDLTGSQLELAAEDLRLAARAIGRLSGHVDVEDVLDVIFADFCIGK